MNINEKTRRLASGDVVKKRFCRRKLHDAISVRRQEAIETLQHAWIVFNDSDGAHAIANANEEKFADYVKQSLAICRDRRLQFLVFPGLFAYRLYPQAVGALFVSPANYTPAARSTTLCEIRHKADICRRPTRVSAAAIGPGPQPSGGWLVEHCAKTQMRGRKIVFLGLPCGRTKARTIVHGTQV
jgi:hypothetical protein